MTIHSKHPFRIHSFSSIDDTSCPPEESGCHRVVAPLEIPAGQAGGADRIPGAWAEYAMTVPWKVARKARKLQTRAITLLKGATTVREPLQRSSTLYTGKRLDERIGSKAANVEPILIQIVGEISQQECTSCLQNNGPWAKCIRFHDIDRIVTACGNCQWNGQERRCDFFQLPLIPDTPRGHQRGRSSQSSITSLEVRMNSCNNKAEAGLVATELEQVVRQLQAEVIVPARAFIPTTTPDQRKAQFDRILGMLSTIKEQFANIQHT
ncbi:hypothetical protein N7530_008299 [Penicillium desertorum]|uniref:Uncharacterized protein n=1 Tax=Penicillium desertorum TaxID=1303715 RepID=A0A9W9WPM6_9EURO|nr:hypothetical protein N7530_008299 [Penicillium desertorum]